MIGDSAVTELKQEAGTEKLLLQMSLVFGDGAYEPEQIVLLSVKHVVKSQLGVIGS